MRGGKISPSMMCADFARLEDCIKKLEKCGVEYLHIDVMDGDFVPNFTLGPDYVRALRGMTSIPIDLHLMVRKPELHITSFGLQEGDIVSVHWEATDHMQRALRMIRDSGATPAVALNPATPVEVLEYVLDDIGMVLVMTVNPGFAGQKLVPQTLRKIKKVREFLSERGRDDVEIEADGNVSFENARLMRAAGADIFVAGTSGLFRKDMNIEQAAARLREAIQ